VSLAPGGKQTTPAEADLKRKSAISPGKAGVAATILVKRIDRWIRRTWSLVGPIRA
jgi:hypothetical protein